MAASSCVRACARACVHACVLAYVCVFVFYSGSPEAMHDVAGGGSDAVSAVAGVYGPALSAASAAAAAAALHPSARVLLPVDTARARRP